ncbi:MAG: alpha/beta fold hydrolase [Caulobacteraceae bacterium]
MDQPPPGPLSHSYISQRLRLHYVDWGNALARPLLLIHGGQDHCRNWDWVAQGLCADWRIIAPDLRGHGDSAFSPSGDYSMSAFVYDLAQLIHQQSLSPVRIIAHSMGGAIALRYAGIFPDTVERLVVIEGLGPSPQVLAQRSKRDLAERFREWVAEERALAGRLPRRYPTIEAALARMQEENRHLTPEQARYLTVHGVSQNEDGTYSWKFDNYVRSWTPVDLSGDQLHQLWRNIACPTLLVLGKESWASDPRKDGRIQHFRSAEVAVFEGAGHWVHHDQLEAFLAAMRRFL